jgi:hypothetical protein
MPAGAYKFDRYLRYDEMVDWLRDMARRHPELLAVESYGRSHEGRDLLLATITDTSTGAHDTKPAHWVDANIHSVEVTAGVAALRLIDHLVTGHGADDVVTRALQTRTFYVVPRVNPDGVEWALADAPRYRRSSTRAWPWKDSRSHPGLEERDIDGDGRILQMRIPDPHGSWVISPDDDRLMVPVPIDGVEPERPRYRMLYEGILNDYDGWTMPTPRPPEGLDLNRNFPSGWSTTVTGSGDHPLSEPEIDALVRAMTARPNICGYNAYHTSGGVLLRPSSTQPDSSLPPIDLWVWKHLAERGAALTGYPAHSVFEDFTWDKSDTMSGAADDWVYDHLGVYGWTTEFWDVIHAATGTKQSTHFWYTGPTDAEQLAVLRWSDEHHPEMFVAWQPFDHPQLGGIEIGGWDEMCSWTNPPRSRLADEVAGHAEFAVAQALAAPCLEVPHTTALPLGDGVWRVEVGIANTGWLPTHVSERARKDGRVLPITATIQSDVEVLGGTARVELGQLAGASSARFNAANDGTPDRVLATWIVRTARDRIDVTVSHQRAGCQTVSVALAN